MVVEEYRGGVVHGVVAVITIERDLDGVDPEPLDGLIDRGADIRCPLVALDPISAIDPLGSRSAVCMCMYHMLFTDYATLITVK